MELGRLFPALLFCFAAIVAPGQTFKTLVNFDISNGASPDLMSLVQGRDGNLYGTTYFGGAQTKGTIFRITQDGILTTIYSFCLKTNCSDGISPAAGLTLATDGNFYGTTEYGGVHGQGTVFRVTPSGKLTTLYSLPSYSNGLPLAGLVQASDGNFYGATQSGGTKGCGIVFKITPSGAVTPLHSFVGYPTEGCSPLAGLIQASDGNLYGTTAFGSSTAGAPSAGTVFKITLTGKLTTLYAFCIGGGACNDGEEPVAGLVQGVDGNFYGTTIYGGPSRYGTVYKITPGGTLTTLHVFNSTDGALPYAGLIQASDGNLYGTTLVGGAGGYGTVFAITPQGLLTTLHTFHVGDGANPYGGLVQATNGIFYGTTYGFGERSSGTVFGLSLFLPPHIEPRSD